MHDPMVHALPASLRSRARATHGARLDHACVHSSPKAPMHQMAHHEATLPAAASSALGAAALTIRWLATPRLMRRCSHATRFARAASSAGPRGAGWGGSGGRRGAGGVCRGGSTRGGGGGGDGHVVAAGKLLGQAAAGLGASAPAACAWLAAAAGTRSKSALTCGCSGSSL
jgi:hypothetical protein